MPNILRLSQYGLFGHLIGKRTFLSSPFAPMSAHHSNESISDVEENPNDQSAPPQQNPPDA